MFEDWGKKIGDFAQTMVKKTGEVAEVASLHTKVLARKKKVDDEMQALGRAFYETHKEDAAEFADKIAAINGIYSEIAALEEEIRILKEKMPEADREKADAMENDGPDLAEEAMKGVKEAADFAGEVISDAVDGVKEIIETVKEKEEEPAEAAEEAAETAEAPQEEAAETTEEPQEEAAEKTEEPQEETAETAEEPQEETAETQAPEAE